MTSTLAIHIAADGSPELLLDDEPVAGDAWVTLAACDIAALAARLAAFGAVVGAEALSVSRRTRRSVERDAEGRITAIVDEPIL